MGGVSLDLAVPSTSFLTGQVIKTKRPSDTMTTTISRSNSSSLTSIKMIVLFMLAMSIILVVVEGFTTIPSLPATSSTSSSSSSSLSSNLLMVSTASTGRSRPNPLTSSTRLYVDIPSPREKVIPIIITDNESDDDDENENERSYQQPVVDTTAPAPAPDHSGTTKSLPWSDVQDWALRDNVPKYLFRIQATTSEDDKKNGAGSTAATTTTTTTLKSYCQWRSLLQDVPELAGYPVDFLQLKYQEQQQKQQPKKEDGGDVPVIGILPYLQDYEFTTQGGVVGTVYGLEGVAEGSRIETSALKGVQETLRLGYVQTTEGIAFEVGRPMSKMLDDGRGNDANTPWKILSNSRAAVAASTAASSSSSLVSGVQSATQKGVNQLASSSELQSTDELLVRLGATTGILLAGATAINMISHHMTVNVFWV